MLHTLISPDKYDCKPNGGAVKTSFFSPEVITTVNDLSELTELLCRGHAINPAVVRPAPTDTGPSNNSEFISQELWFIDLDNFNPEKPHRYPLGVDHNLNLTNILQLCSTHHLPPFLVYETYSSTKIHPRFRVGIATTTPVTNSTVRLKYSEALIRLFQSCFLYVDKLRSHASTFFGTNKSASYSNPEAYVELSVMDSIADIQFTSELPSVDGVDTMTDSNLHTSTIVNKEEHEYCNCSTGVKKASELYCQANKVPFEKLIPGLVTPNHFRCMLQTHADIHPSAFIKAVDRGNDVEYFYHCRGCGQNVSGVEFVKRTRHVKKFEALESILKLRDELQPLRKYRQGLTRMHRDNPKIYHKMYWHLNNGNDIMMVLIDTASGYGYLHNNELYFALSDELIAKKLLKRGLYKSIAAVSDTRRKLAACGAFRMVEDNEFEAVAPNYYEFILDRSRHHSHPSFFAVRLDVPFDKWLTRVYETYQERQKKGARGLISFDGEIMYEGRSAAKKVYVQGKRGEVSREVNELFDEFYQRGLTILEHQAWITKKLIKGNRWIGRVDQCWPKLLQELNLEEVLVNADRRATHGIPETITRNSKVAVKIG